MEQHKNAAGDVKVRSRRAAGVVLALVGVVVLFGGFTVPWSVVLEDPQLVPAPELWLGVWLIVLGAAVALWPAARHGGSSDR